MRKQTPNILGEILGRPDDRQLVRSELHYDYSLIPDEFRGQVQAAAVEIIISGRKAQEHMIEVGKRLIEVKEMLEHGQFSDWCSAEFDMSQRTATNMMNVARVFGDQNGNSVSVLSDSALYMLAAPSTPEPARIEVIEEAQATGQSPTKARVRQIIDTHRPDKPSRTLESAVPVIDIEPTPQPVPPPAAAAPSRNGQVDQLLTLYRMALESTGDYEQLTGIYSHSQALRRALQPMIETLVRNRS